MKLVVGKSRSGKTFGVVEALKRQVGKLVICDPQNSLCHEYVTQMVGKRRVLLDNIGSIKRGLRVVGLKKSDSKDELERLKENNMSREMVEQYVYGRTGTNETENPLRVEYGDLAMRAVQFQKEPVPLYWMMHALQPGSDGFMLLKARCTDEETRWEMSQLQGLARSKPELIRQTGPAIRILKPMCNDAHLIARCGDAEFDEALEQHDTIIAMGEDATDRTIEIVMQVWINKVIQYVRFKRRPVTLVIDEAANWNLLSPSLLQGIASQQKNGLNLVIITQSLNFEDEVIETITQNVQRIECFQAGSNDTADLMANILGTRMLNRNKVAHTRVRERQIHDGYDEFDGKSRYRQTQESEPIYQGYGDQLKEIKKEIMELPRQSRIVADSYGVRKEKVPTIKPRILSPSRMKRVLTEFYEAQKQSKWLEAAEYKKPVWVSKSTGKKGIKKSSNGRKST